MEKEEKQRGHEPEITKQSCGLRDILSIDMSHGVPIKFCYVMSQLPREGHDGLTRKVTAVLGADTALRMRK